MVVAVFVPTLAWGDGRAAQAPAKSFLVGDNFFQESGSIDPADNSITVPAGSSVGWVYPADNNVHNAHFREESPKPASCVSTQGPPSSPTSVPDGPQQGPWAGECQ